MAEKVLHDLPSFSVQDLRKVLSRTGEAVRKFALRGLTAISEGPKAQPLFDEVMAAAQDEDADLRYTAALCMARLGWEEFRPMAAQLAEEDDDEDVRDYAKWVAEVLDELHG
nr:adaptin domain-containing protein [Pseudenhygromyxa sp. WMMC2535]